MKDAISPLHVVSTNCFEREMHRMQRRNKNLSKVDPIVDQLARRQLLAARFKDHPLKGNWKGYRECHIEPDWLLVYRIQGDKLILERTGTHNDLF